MWFEGSRLNSVRHECKHEDDIKRWGWKEFNPGSYGKQQLVDIHNFIKMDMIYLQQQNDWVLQINGTQTKQGTRPRNLSMIVYYGVSGKNGKLQYPSLSRIEKKQVIKIVLIKSREQKKKYDFHSFLKILVMEFFILIIHHPIFPLQI